MDKQPQPISRRASAQELVELANSKDSGIIQQVALHPNTPPVVLKELFIKFPAEVLNNSAINLLLFEDPKLFEDFFWRNTECFKRNYLPLYYQKWAANHSHRFIRSVVAGSHKISEEIIEILAEDLEYEVIHSLLTNSRLTSSILWQLALFAMKPENSRNNLIFEIGLHSNVDHKLRRKLYLFYKEQRDNFDDMREMQIRCNDDFYRIIKATSLQMMRLRWTKHMGEKYLKKTYRRRCRFQLSNEQIIEFWKYLLDSPTPLI